MNFVFAFGRGEWMPRCLKRRGAVDWLISYEYVDDNSEVYNMLTRKKEVAKNEDGTK